MELEENGYHHLEELSKSDFEIVDGEPDITGWKVINESSIYVGIVTELLFDNQDYAVRYLIIDLNENGMHLDHKKVMVPIGLAHLHINNDEVVLPNIHIDQFNALPNYEAGKIGPDTEMYVRSVIGSPAALRIEETISEFDQQQFYTHHHFDQKRFYQRGGTTNGTVNEDVDDPTTRGI
jgi:sporulation protein YlmC with PRC-barrel domain